MWFALTVGVLLFSNGLVSGSPACPAAPLADATHMVDASARDLRHISIPEGSSAISPAAEAGLRRFKDALTAAATAVFGCAPATGTPEEMQNALAAALHANAKPQPDTPVEGPGGRLTEVFGTNLQVQVFPLSEEPKLLEVDFRYDVPCGDDNLLLVYEARPQHRAASVEAAAPAWHPQLRWDTEKYETVADALGDFVLLTPLNGSYQHPVWRYVVAHGHPGCGDPPRESQFTLDLLAPVAGSLRPQRDWTFSHAYQAGVKTPRLATTEDTLTFQLVQPHPPGTGEAAANGTPFSSATSFRFRLDAQGRLVPASESETPRPVPPAR